MLRQCWIDGFSSPWVAAKTIQGDDACKARSERKLAVKHLVDIENLARALGMITGPKTKGRRPGRYSATNRPKTQKRACIKAPSGADCDRMSKRELSWAALTERIASADMSP